MTSIQFPPFCPFCPLPLVTMVTKVTMVISFDLTLPLFHPFFAPLSIYWSIPSCRLKKVNVLGFIFSARFAPLKPPSPLNPLTPVHGHHVAGVRVGR